MSKVLVVDDEASWRDDLEQALVPIHCEVVTEQDRSTALGLILREFFDLVIVNVQLKPTPQPDEIVSEWIELLELIRYRGAETIVVASRGLPPPIVADRLVRVAFRDYHVADFIIKEDFSPEQYLETVQNCMQKRIEAWTTTPQPIYSKPGSVSGIGPIRPHMFIEGPEVPLLFRSLRKFAQRRTNGDVRRDIMVNAFGELPGHLNVWAVPDDFAQALLSWFRSYHVTTQLPDQHPMILFLEYLSLTDLEQYGLGVEDEGLYNQLIKRGHENLQALKACSAVGRVESPKGTPIGSGVLLSEDLFLTCYHVVKAVSEAWVHFDHETGVHSPGNRFELDLNSLSAHNQPDHALMRIKGKPQQRPVTLVCKNLSSGEKAGIRIIHYPQELPLVISSLGHIRQVGHDYIAHDLETDRGSSGAPIFDHDWDVVAIHRGNPTSEEHSLPEGTLEGVPIHALWDIISAHLS